MNLQDAPPFRRLLGRLERHRRWGRDHGYARLLEEDQLDPFTRIPNAVRKWRWRRAHGLPPGQAVPVFLVGLQRSGTNMLVHGFETSPEFEVRNENDRKAFERYRLRPDPVIRDLVERSRHRFVLLKPLCDSHRVGDLLDSVGSAKPGKAIWAYRSVDARVRSAVAKFGDTNLQLMREIAGGGGSERWQAQRLSADSLDLIRSLDYEHLSPASGAALFWYVRNALYFEQGLHERDDVTLTSYEMTIADPPGAIGTLCRFLGVTFSPDLVAHIDSRSRPEDPLDIDPVVRERCTQLTVRLEQAVREKAASVP